jgi:MFS family permease
MGGVLMSAPVGLIVSMPLAGWLIHTRGSRNVAGGAAVLYATTLVIIGAVPNAIILVGTLFFFGFFGNLLNIAMNTQAVEVEELYGRSIMASFHGLWSLASFVGAFTGAYMLGINVSPFGHFLLIGVLAAAITGMCYPMLVRNAVPEAGNVPWIVKPDKTLILLAFIALGVMICEGAMADWSGIYFKKVVHTEAAFVGFGYAAFTCTMALGRFLADGLVGRLGMKKVLEGSGLLIALGLTLVISYPRFQTSILGLLLVGAGTSSVIPLVFSSVGKTKKTNPATALASVSTIGFMGLLFGPPLIGFISGATSLRVAFGFVALLGLMISVLATRLRSAP